MNTSKIKASYNEHRHLFHLLGITLILFVLFSYYFHPFRQMEIDRNPWHKAQIKTVYQMITNPRFATDAEAYYCPQYLALTSSPITELHFYFKNELFSDVETIESYKSVCESWLPVFYQHYLDAQKTADITPKSIDTFYSISLWDNVLANLYDDNKNSYMKEYREQHTLYAKNASNCHLTKDKKNMQCEMEFESKNAFEKANSTKVKPQ